ncbi:MAG: zinc ribbon domain-containing protein [Chloroflexi bacterium]|nr:zinc ribbon domain-containing protein [Chloroflexota bacterium]
MPAYTYRCAQCQRRFTVRMTYAEYDTATVTCPHCGSDAVSRVLPRVRVLRSETDHLAALADPQRLAALDEDPQALGKMMREMEASLGEDMGAEFDEVVERLEKGQSPTEIDAAMSAPEPSAGDTTA